MSHYLSPISSNFSGEGRHPSFKRGTKSSCRDLFLSVIWGITGGGIVGQAVSPYVNWPTLLTLPLPLLSLLVSSSESCTLEAKVNRCNRFVFSIQGITSISSFVGGVASSIFFGNYLTALHQATVHSATFLNQNIYSTFDVVPLNHKDIAKSENLQLILSLAQGILIGVHFLSRYALIQKKAAVDDEEVTTVEEQPLDEELEQLKGKTEQIEMENAKWKEAFQNLKAFVESDQILAETFKTCYEETKEILLPPFEEDDSPPVTNSIAESWRRAAQRQLYYEELLISFKDFLNKNPTFLEALKERVQVTRQAVLDVLYD